MKKSTLILIGAAAAGGYYLYTRQKAEEKTAVAATPQTPLTLAAPALTVEGAPPAANTIPGGGFWSAIGDALINLTPFAVPALVIKAAIK